MNSSSNKTTTEQISGMESALFRFQYNKMLETDLADAIDKFTTAHAIQNKGECKNWSTFHNSCKFFIHHITANRIRNENASVDIRKKETMWNVIFTDTIMDYYDNYEILVNFLSIYNLAVIEKDEKGFLHFNLPGQYKGVFERELTAKELKRKKSIYKKSSDRAARILPVSGLSFEYAGQKIDAAFVEYALRNNKNSKGEAYGEEEIQKAIKIVAKLNGGQKMFAKAGRRGRLYSDITGLGAVLTDLLVINGKETITLDQHATYLWLLPAVIEDSVSEDKRPEKLKNELESFKSLLNHIAETQGNLYSHFATCWNIPMAEIKQNIITWLCDPNVNNLEGIKKQIDEEFSKMYPAIRAAMKSFSTGANGMSTRAMHLEGKFFNRLCRQVNHYFYRAVTKFDSIIVQDGFQRRAWNKAFILFRSMFGYSPFLKIKTTNGNYMNVATLPATQNQIVATLQAPSSLTNDELNTLQHQKSLHFNKGEGEDNRNTSLVIFDEYVTNNDTSEASTSGTCGTSDDKENVTKRKRSEIKDHRSGWKICVAGKYHYSKKSETKDKFKERVMKDLGLTERDIK